MKLLLALLQSPVHVVHINGFHCIRFIIIISYFVFQPRRKRNSRSRGKGCGHVEEIPVATDTETDNEQCDTEKETLIGDG